MRRLLFIAIALVLVSGMVGCARANRIADDIEWVFFDGEPWEKN